MPRAYREALEQIAGEESVETVAPEEVRI
jgi:hypothetical protein